MSTFLDELRAIVAVSEQEPLARHTTFHIGGPAEWYVVARSAAELQAILRVAYRHQMPFFILSGGSNLLVSDRGIAGLVIDNRAQAVTVLERDSSGALVEAESGTPMATLARRMARDGLAGLEWAVGIPGTVGGGVVFNAGAHGSDFSSVLVEAQVLAPSGETAWIGRDDLQLGYRQSIFTLAAPERPVGTVLRARFRLGLGDPARLQEQVGRYNDHRRTTQPAKASAGSIFKNPPGDSSGRLIEAAGLKGRRRGQAQISELHANFIVNLGQASASDVLALMREAQAAVKEQFGIELELEVRLAGDWNEEGRDAG